MVIVYTTAVGIHREKQYDIIRVGHSAGVFSEYIRVDRADLIADEKLIRHCEN